MAGLTVVLLSQVVCFVSRAPKKFMKLPCILDHFVQRPSDIGKRDVGGIPNRKDVCIFKVNMNQHVFFAFAVFIFNAT